MKFTLYKFKGSRQLPAIGCLLERKIAIEWIRDTTCISAKSCYVARAGIVRIVRCEGVLHKISLFCYRPKPCSKPQRTGLDTFDKISFRHTWASKRRASPSFQATIQQSYSSWEVSSLAPEEYFVRVLVWRFLTSAELRISRKFRRVTRRHWLKGSKIKSCLSTISGKVSKFGADCFNAFKVKRVQNWRGPQKSSPVK